MKKFLLTLLVVAISGCTTLGSMFSSLGAGALSGTALGAGTGAIIGASIDNGNAGESALLGAAIGLVAGGITGAIVENRSEEHQRKEFLEKVRYNQQDTYEREREIDELRKQVEGEIPHGLPSQETKKYLYTGE